MQVAQFEGWGIVIRGYTHVSGGNKWKKAHYFIGHQSLCGLDKQQDLDRFTIIKPSSKKHKCRMCLLQIKRYGSPQRALEVKNGVHDDNPNIIRKLDYRKLNRIGKMSINKPVEKKLVPAICAEPDCNATGMAFEPVDGKPKPHFCEKHDLKIKEASKLA